jgi:DNA invertase Pin-like site-specific DNA recombinase
MPIAYSYKRFSSDAQEGNDSIRRQTAAASKYIEENPELGLVLDTTLSLTDAGVSAYKGKNLKQGALGVFMEAVRDGLIQPGSWLLLESLDRFTRQSVNIAANELLSLINRGIVVVTLHNQTIYREEDFQGSEGLVNLLGALIAMQGHFQEQMTKGKRVAAAWAANYSKAAAGGHVVTKIVPFWLSVNADRSGFNVLEDKAAIVREIYERRASGEGKTAIANSLTASGVPTSKGRGNLWHPSAVAKLLDSDTPSGALVNKHGERFEGYYPAIVEPALFQAVRALRSAQPSQGKSTKAHVLTGLVKHDCGTTMRRVNKGERSVVKLQCPKCMNGLKFTEAVNLVSQALFESQWVEAPSVHGADLLSKERALEALTLEIEEAWTAWRLIKTLEARKLWEGLNREAAEAKKELVELKSTNTEVLASMEEANLLRHSKAGNIIGAARSVITSASMDTECTTLSVRLISGKTVTVTTMGHAVN